MYSLCAKYESFDGWIPQKKSKISRVYLIDKIDAVYGVELIGERTTEPPMFGVST